MHAQHLHYVKQTSLGFKLVQSLELCARFCIGFKLVQSLENWVDFRSAVRFVGALKIWGTLVFFNRKNLDLKNIHFVRKKYAQSLDGGFFVVY
jgi:hypothetical protein